MLRKNFENNWLHNKHNIIYVINMCKLTFTTKGNQKND